MRSCCCKCLTCKCRKPCFRTGQQGQAARHNWLRDRSTRQARRGNGRARRKQGRGRATRKRAASTGYDLRSGMLLSQRITSYNLRINIAGRGQGTSAGEKRQGGRERTERAVESEGEGEGRTNEGGSAPAGRDKDKAAAEGERAEDDSFRASMLVCDSVK